MHNTFYKVLLMIVYLGLSFWYLPKLLKITSVETKGNTVVVKKGFFIKREYRYPRGRICVIRKIRFPLQSVMGLVTPIIEGVGTVLVLPLMTEKQALLFEKEVQRL